MGRDYPYNMHRIWKGFLDEAGLNVKAGTYQAFGTYIHVLRRLALIRRAGGSPSTFGKTYYYALNPEKVNPAVWRNPFKHYSRL